MKISRMPPKYTCTICNKVFRRRKQRDDHILFNKCRGNRRTAKNIIIEPTDLELMNMATNKYFGRAYNFNNIVTGNRHYRCGLPLPRISKWSRAAI